MDSAHLITWMQSVGHTNSSLAVAMGYSYEYIYKLTAGERPVTEGFRWRFAQKFGWQEAERVFAENLATPTPA